MKSVVVYGFERNHEIHEIHEKSFGETANLHTWEMAEVDQKTQKTNDVSLVGQRTKDKGQRTRAGWRLAICSHHPLYSVFCPLSYSFVPSEITIRITCTTPELLPGITAFAGNYLT